VAERDAPGPTRTGDLHGRIVMRFQLRHGCVVCPARFELATSRFAAWCASGLRYGHEMMGLVGAAPTPRVYETRALLLDQRPEDGGGYIRDRGRAPKERVIMVLRSPGAGTAVRESSRNIESIPPGGVEPPSPPYQGGALPLDDGDESEPAGSCTRTPSLRDWSAAVTDTGPRCGSRPGTCTLTAHVQGVVVLLTPDGIARAAPGNERAKVGRALAGLRGIHRQGVEPCFAG
jgi:hypothetical protein